MALLLGRLQLQSTALLSPLEGVSDCGFRSLCASLGAALTWTEMIRAQAIARNNGAAFDLIDLHTTESTTDTTAPTGIQLLAKSGDELRRALERICALSDTPARAHFRNIKAVDLKYLLQVASGKLTF